MLIIIIVIRVFFIINRSYTISSHPECYNEFVSKDKAIVVRTALAIIDSVKNAVVQSDDTIFDRYWDYMYGVKGRYAVDSIYVDTLYYNSKCTKMISFVIFRTLRQTEIKDQNLGKYEYVYDCMTMFGIRDSLEMPWRLYGWNQVTSKGFKTARKAFERIVEDYTNDNMRSDIARIYMSDWSQKDVEFGYNLTDKDFWDSCIIWRPNTRGKGVYLFQTVTSGIRADQQLPDIKVELTEAEKELFRKEKTVCK